MDVCAFLFLIPLACRMRTRYNLLGRTYPRAERKWLMMKVTLTIDDIASKNTPAIVDYLQENGIQAVMFAVGTNVERYYDEAVYAVKKGIIVGNHSYSHPSFSRISFREGVEEFEKNEALLDRLYRDAGAERKFRPVRFPYGDKGGENKAAYQEYFTEKGFTKLDDSGVTYPWWKVNNLDKDIDTHWTYDFEEYRVRPGSGFTFDDVLKKMSDPAPRWGGPLFDETSRHILLLHAHDETEELVPEYYRILLDRLLDRGAEFSLAWRK